MASWNEQLLDIVDKFQEKNPGPFTAKQAAAFGLSTGMYKPHAGKLLSMVAEEISRAMREQYIKDPQNRTVRAKHVARLVVEGEQKSLWDSIDTAEPWFMQVALKQRRQQIVGDCKQLKIDTDSYNENWNTSEPIQMSLNFTADVEELELVGA